MSTTPRAADLAYKAITAVCGLSLGVNAFLIQLKLSEITDSVNKLNDNIGTITNHQATLETRLEIYANVTSTHNERLQYLERRR